MALLKFKRSAVPGKVPTLADLSLGELAINTFDGKVYIRKDSGTASIVEVGGGSGVLSFNSRTGAVTLTSGDVTGALGYTPANRAGDTFTGNVGIGHSPSFALDINGNARSVIGNSYFCYTADYGMGTPDSNGLQIFASNGDTIRFGHRTGGTTFTERMILGTGGNVTANVDFRAPIFYDSQNTAYYLDPQNTSVLWEAATYYLRNIEDVSVNHPYGIYFSNNRSSAYAIFRESGAWTNPFPDLRIAFHTGIKIGANAGYQGVRFYSDFDMATQVMSVNNASDPLGGLNVYVNNSLQADSSLRAPIFYDSNNTGFYVDPTGTSIMADAVIAGRAMNSAMYYAGFTLDANTMPTNSTGFTYQVNAPYFGPVARFGTGGAYDLWLNAPYTGGNGLSFRTRDGDNATLNAWQSVVVYNSNRASGDIYANIYYDNNNTAFYLDPAGNSILSTLRASNIQFPSGTVAINLDNTSYQIFRSPDGGIRMYLGGADAANYYDNETHWFRNRATSNVAYINANGVYAPVFYDFSDSGYYIDPNSTGTSFRGRGQVYLGPNANSRFLAIGGDPGSTDESRVATSNGNLHIDSRAGHQLYLNWYSAQPVWSEGGAYFPIYYDRQDSSFYCDPNGTSVLNTVNTWGEIGPRRNDVQSLLRSYNTSAGQPLQFYLDHNFGNVNIGNNRGVVFAGGTYWEIANSVRSPIFYDSNNTGYYLDPASNSNLLNINANYIRSFGNIDVDQDLVVGTASGKTFSFIYMRDADEGQRAIHCNSNRIGFLNQGGGWGSWCEDDGAWATDFAVYSPIYYDRNNTFFYLNLDGYSQVNGFGSVNGSSGVGMSIMGNPSNGAIMSFHRSNAFAINMGLDTDNVFRMGGWSAAANRLQMDMSGNLTMAGNVTAFSDIRLKKDIETIDGALDLVSKMRGVRFTRIENEERNVGVIAQEMLEVLPEVVQQGVGDDDTLSVAYGNLVGVLIEAIKELRAEVEELKATTSTITFEG